MKKNIMLLFCSLILVGCDVRYGFIESKFKLASESRLPIWFSMYSKNNSNKLYVFITMYSNPINNKAKIDLYSPGNESKIIASVVGLAKWTEETEKEFERKGSYAIYPNYIRITVDGISEVFEQKDKSNILFIVDKVEQ